MAHERFEVYLAAFIQANLWVTLFGFGSWLRLEYIWLMLREGPQSITKLAWISPPWKEGHRKGWSLQQEHKHVGTQSGAWPVLDGRRTIETKGCLLPWAPKVCTHQEHLGSVLDEEIPPCSQHQALSDSYLKARLYVIGLRQVGVFNSL